MRSLGFGPRDEADGLAAAASATAGASPASPALTADEIQAGRRDVLERLARHELSAEEAAEAIRALGKDVR